MLRYEQIIQLKSHKSNCDLMLSWFKVNATLCIKPLS